MCTAGKVFARIATDILLFLVVLFVLFIAFSMLFYVNFRLTVDEFSTFGKSIFSVFKGLQGDMDAVGLYTSDPLLGPIIYALYVCVMLYICFTMLIGMITISYESVKDDPCPEGKFLMTVHNKITEVMKTFAEKTAPTRAEGISDGEGNKS